MAENVNRQHLDCIYDEEPLGFDKDPMALEKKQPQDPFEEVNLGEEGDKRPTYISTNIDQKLKSEVILLLKEWLKSTFGPFMKKNGNLRVCIDFRDLNAATPKDEYTMHVAEMLIEFAAGFEYLSMLDGYACYNQIFIVEDVPKKSFCCPGALGTYEWVVMPFGLKNAGVTYQRKEHQEAFEKIKEYLMKPPILAPHVRSRPMRLYITASDSTIDRMLVQENDDGVERPVYYLSRMLNGLETSRIGKWALALTEYSLTYAPLKAMKGQVVAYFLVDHSMVSMPQNYVDLVPWKLNFDGSSHKNGRGIGEVIISPNGIPVEFKYLIDGVCTNNETEYESLITGLELLLELGARNVEIMGDSELVVKQVSKEYKCVKKNLIMYFVIVNRLLKQFESTNIRHIPRRENQEANDLAQEASGYKKNEDGEPIQIRDKVRAIVLSSSNLSIIKLNVVDAENFEILIVENGKENDWRQPLVEYLRNPTGSTDRKIKYRALNFVLIENELFKKMAEGILLKCLGESEAYLAISNDCIEFAKGFQVCQMHGGIQHVPTSELHAIVKPWPFRGWALDVIGEIKPASSKQQRYILVGIDYFTKWVEAVALRNVDQEAVIDFLQNHIICRFGLLETITTDQGTVFTGQIMREFAQEVGIKLLTSTPYYAQANGQVEAANKVIISLIKKHVGRKPKNWHQSLDQALWACRTSPKEATGTTPFRLTYGHMDMTLCYQ
ncbi:uncharacterized protein LOC131597235 [Vicia villosa]|uniref:uncharacterized protein LOC131597235 n=1 Tax=Vicia villosa TaxID=3911 RepID=UPI00273B93AB|nr:uncharacterized protein LOC131597235 [Vicia villosa]